MTASAISERELDEQLAALLERHSVPGAAVGVLQAGGELRCARGDTNVEHPLPVDDRTLFQVASNTKPFTASLALGLAERGRLDLDAPVRSYLPEFRLPDPAATGRVTVRHLLTHRVGWDGDALFVQPPARPELGAIFEPMAKARQLVAPGGDWTYSNAGFSVAGRLVEVLEGAPFPEVLRDRILAPLAMDLSCTRADEAITHRVAAPHVTLPDGPTRVLRGRGWQPGWELEPHDVPAGGLISCVSDLLRWLAFQLGRLECDAPPLSRAALARMHEPQLPAWNAEAGHAIGWAIWLANGRPLLCHGGLTAGYTTWTMFSPELDFAAVILTNALAGGRLHRELSRWLVGRRTGETVRSPEPSAEQPAPEPYLGDYWGAFGLRTVTAADGALVVTTTPHATDGGGWQPPPDPPLRLAFYAPDRALVLEPEAFAGNLVDFGRSRGRVAWLRLGARICVRV